MPREEVLQGYGWNVSEAADPSGIPLKVLRLFDNHTGHIVVANFTQDVAMQVARALMGTGLVVPQLTIEPNPNSHN